ncbi:hypothetical protein BGW80DRAFT_560879 [Lactifluus volemus]|nr:hypothetical protein BGW80DRAFT_560879 [Lactifluus volemus]
MLHSTHFRSTAVTVAPGGDVSFLCQGKRGAVLSLPVDARREDTVAKGDFGRWMIKHIDNWFSFTKRLGLGIDRMEEIVFVTGCHLARSSTNVVFENQVDAPVSFGAQVAGDTVTWQVPSIPTPGVVLNRGPSGTNLPENQCLFVRGFRVTRRLKILPRQLRGAAGNASDSNGHDSEPEMESTSVPMVTKVKCCTSR